MLAALGFDHACVTRIDGMYFVGTDYRGPSSYPLAGSSADLLERELRTQDFVWRAPDGSEALCHWNAFTYFQGDMLAHIGVIRWMGVTFGCRCGAAGTLRAASSKLVAQLGLSHVRPTLLSDRMRLQRAHPRLLELLDRYNAPASATRASTWSTPAWTTT